MIRFLKSLPIVRQTGRWWVNTFLEGTVTPIYQGQAQGMLWQRRKRYVHGYWLGDFELDFQQALANSLKPGMTFFDVGANAGFYSLVAWKQIGPAGKCVSIDPDPDNCVHMNELKRLNKLDRWEIVEEAVAGQEGTLTFQTSVLGDSGGHLIGLQLFTGDNPLGKNFREVHATTLDDLTRRFGKPDVIKVDIEGAEWEAFRDGAAQLLSVHRPVMFLELHGFERARLLQALFEQHRYTLKTLTGQPATFPHNDIFHVVAHPQQG